LQEQIESLQAELSNFQTQSTQKDGADEALEQLRGKIEVLELARVDKDAQIADRMAALEASLEEKIGTMVADAVTKQAREPRPTRQRRQPEARLLNRAIKDESSDKSEAMSRIIQARVQNALSEAETIEESVAKEDADDAATEHQDAIPDEPTNDSNGSVVEDTEALEGEAVAPDAVSDSELPESIDRHEMADTEVETADDALVPEPPHAEDEGGDLFAGAVPFSVPSKEKIKKRDTALIVESLIGIGNKPYLRGSGGGLNWDTGVPMEFESIGKWRWVVSEDFEDAIEFQVMRNDADPDLTGKHRMVAGDKLSVQPQFD
jgi:hypothetical protein